MPVLLVTNKVTHARVVAMARNADDAAAIHPTCDTARRVDSGWVRTVGGHHYRDEWVPAPPGWPHNLAFVHVDLLATNDSRMLSGTTSVMAYQPSMDLRHEGEGGSDRWGGYTLDALAPGAEPREPFDD